MDRTSLEALARAVVDCMNHADFDRLESLFQPGAEWCVNGCSPVSTRLPIAEFAAMMRAFARGPDFVGISITVRSLIIDAERAAIEWTSVVKRRQQEDYLNSGVFVLEGRDGRLTGAREYLDTFWSTKVLLGQDAREA